MHLFLYTTTNRTKFFLRITIIILLLTAAAFLLLPVPIHREFKAGEFQFNNPNHLEPYTVSFDGFYHFNLFTDSEFHGLVKILNHPAIDIMQEEEVVLKFDSDPSVAATYEYVRRTKDEHGEITRHVCNIGVILARPFIKDPCILLSLNASGQKIHTWNEAPADGSCDTGNGYFLAPASDYEAAIQLYQSY